MITKLMALIAITTIAIGLQVLTLIYGWGLEVKNWAAVILIGVFGQAFAQAVAGKILKEACE
jgi:hypothetical protein